MAGKWISETTHAFAKIVGAFTLKQLLDAHGKEGYFKEKRVKEFEAEGLRIIPWFKPHFVPTNNGKQASLAYTWQQRARQCCGEELGNEKGVRDELARFRDNKILRPIYDMAETAVQFGYPVPLEEVQIELDTVMIAELAGQIGGYVVVNMKDPNWIRVGMATDLGRRLATHREYGFLPYLVYVTGNKSMAKALEETIKIHITKVLGAYLRTKGQKPGQNSHYTLPKGRGIEDVDKVICTYLCKLFKQRCTTR